MNWLSLRELLDNDRGILDYIEPLEKNKSKGISRLLEALSEKSGQRLTIATNSEDLSLSPEQEKELCMKKKSEAFILKTMEEGITIGDMTRRLEGQVSENTLKEIRKLAT